MKGVGVVGGGREVGSVGRRRRRRKREEGMEWKENEKEYNEGM